MLRYALALSAASFAAGGCINNNEATQIRLCLFIAVYDFPDGSCNHEMAKKSVFHCDQSVFHSVFPAEYRAYENRRTKASSYFLRNLRKK